MTDSRLSSAIGSDTVERWRFTVRGTVQGVGFRPFVFRLAEELGLIGLVGNDSEGVVIEVQGTVTRLAEFAHRLNTECPPLARITESHRRRIELQSQASFVISTSKAVGATAPVIPPDVAICSDCLAEMRDPGNRRYRYPFINCTNCGPRYTITERVPYDRPMTSMKQFAMCNTCADEYHDPRNRRFHAQPNACPKCGPRLWLHDGNTELEPAHAFALVRDSLAEGKIVALRSLGGFHLACDATNENAVAELRRRKQRPHKPLAIMCVDLTSARRLCHISADEAEALMSPSRPILLLCKKDDAIVAANVAPDTDRLGVMLPSAPLHYLLFDPFDRPLVMTSGNLTDEPIVIGNEEALERLRAFADLFILHDREIVQRLDDSIVMFAGGSMRVLRRTRGIVPEPLRLPYPLSSPILACGGELKGTVALGVGNQAVISQHLGDLDNPLSMDNFEQTIEHLKCLLDCSPAIIAHDLHPDYLSTRWAKRQRGVRCIPVQHHHAHLVSVMTENGITEPCLGVILDGTGYGPDGTVWGGEILCGEARSFRRLAWLEPVPMPGGEVAIKEPWRMAISYLIHTYNGTIPECRSGWIDTVSQDSLDIVCDQIRRGVNAPMTSSCGRLFDGVASLLGLCHRVSYEAQAAIRLEAEAEIGGKLTLPTSDGDASQLGPISVSPLIRDIWESARRGEETSAIARRFHSNLAELLIGAAVAGRASTGISRVALSGGVYQNRLFFEYMQSRLKSLDFEVLAHRQVPTNDGGLALGQLVIADSVMREKPKGVN